MQNFTLISMEPLPSRKDDNFMQKNAVYRVLRVEILELLFSKIFFFKSMSNFELISKKYVLSYEKCKFLLKI